MVFSREDLTNKKGGRIIKKFIINLLVIVFALMIQLIIPPNFIFKGVKPDLLLVVSVVTGLIWGVKDGLGFGFISGLFQDLFQDGMFGIFTILKTLTGGLAGFMEGVFFKEKLIFPPLILFILTFLHETLTIFLSEKLLFKVNYFYVMKVIILPEAFLNSLIGFFIYYIYYRICISGGNYHE